MRTHTHLRCNPNWDAYQLGSFLSGEGDKMRSRSELLRGGGHPAKMSGTQHFFGAEPQSPRPRDKEGTTQNVLTFFPYSNSSA